MILIQVVDSHADFRESVGLLLESYGYTVWLAADEREALLMLDTHWRRPSIILLETLQTETARRFTDAVQSRDGNICLFYLVMMGSRIRLEEMNRFNVLHKPLNPEELISRVEHALQVCDLG